jgi:hypothetical protein
MNFLCREIASAIKLLLDSVNDVLKNYTSTGRIMEHKRVSRVELWWLVRATLYILSISLFCFTIAR